MSNRDELARLVSGRPRAFRNVRAVMAVSREGGAYRDAERRFHRRSPELLGFVVTRPDRRRDDSRTDEVWFEPPRRIRIATDGEPTLLCDGTHGWLRDPRGSIWTAVPPENAERKANFVALRPEAVLDNLGVEVVGEVAYLGRSGVRARARRVAAAAAWQDDGGLTPYADEYELIIDRERGVVLQAVARAGGVVISSTKTLELAFDETLPRTLFEPGAGEAVRSAEALFDQRLESLSLSEAPSRVGFPVWALDRIPESWTLEAGYWPPLAEWSEPPRIALLYVSPNGDAYVNLLESPALSEVANAESSKDDAAAGWDEVEHCGERYFVATAPGRSGTSINFSRGRTAIRIDAEGVAEKDLLEIAASLRNISAER